MAASKDVALTTQTVTDKPLASSQTDHVETRTAEGDARASLSPARADSQARPRQKRSVWDRLEAWLSRLSAKNNFTHRLFSLFWLPYAFRSGIRMKRLNETTYAAVLPFNRFNRNWYNAMAGAALLANSEIAGGMYVFGICGGDYVVVCKHLEYRFLRPCFGPAVYKVKPHEDIRALAAEGKEFNITMTLNIMQQIRKPGEKEKRVGRCYATFHATPKHHHRDRLSSRSGSPKK